MNFTVEGSNTIGNNGKNGEQPPTLSNRFERVLSSNQTPVCGKNLGKTPFMAKKKPNGSTKQSRI